MMQPTTTPTELSGTWEAVKGVMLTLSTTGILALLGFALSLRDDVRDLKRDVSGKDGQNGMKSKIAALEERVDLIEDRNLAIDAVDDAARSQYAGPERRQGARRLRDLMRHERDPHDTGGDSA